MFYFFQGCWAVGLLCLCCHLGCAVASQVLRWFLNCAPFYSFQDIKPLSKKEDVLTDEQTQELKEIFELCVVLIVVAPFDLQFSIARHSTTPLLHACLLYCEF
mmetsp:Transcript_10787/g.28287  ORF Transcript_10787/g.28287 Transcript_10787/m.28287 type:complete len:103 (-) Transcript_10787:913-1221(-)